MIRTARPVHPGEVLREEFLEPLGLSAYALAKALKVTRPRIEELVREKRSVTADMALRLSRYFSTTPQFWMTLQANCDLSHAEQDGQNAYAGIQPLQKSA